MIELYLLHLFNGSLGESVIAAHAGLVSARNRSEHVILQNQSYLSPAVFSLGGIFIVSLHVWIPWAGRTVTFSRPPRP